MDPNRLTQKTQEALHDAQTKALRFGHTEVDVEHLLLALLEQPDGLDPAAAGARRRRHRRAAQRRSSARSRAGRASAARAPPAARSASRARSRQLLDGAEQEAERLKDEYVSVEHVLLAMLAAGTRTARRAAAARARRRRASASSRS